MAISSKALLRMRHYYSSTWVIKTRRRRLRRRAHSRKAKYSSFQQYASWNKIDHLISDTDFPEEFADQLQKFTDVILV